MLLFFDIDGTLIDEETHTIPASTFSALQRAHARGHMNFINTGRTLCNLDERLHALPLDGWVCGCGTEILFQGKSILSYSLTHVESLSVVDFCHARKLSGFFEGRDRISLDPQLPSSRGTEAIRSYCEKKGILGSTRDPDFTMVKFFIYTSDLEDIAAIENMPGLPFACIDRGHGGWEVIPRGYSKQSGMECIREKTGMQHEDLVAFGDSRNDLSMLRAAAVSVCMGQAPEDVKAQCTFVTGTPGQDGIEQALLHLHLI